MQPAKPDPPLRELRLSGQDLRALLCAILAKGASFRFKARGFSMSPFIRDGDVVTVSPHQHAKLDPGDIAAFAHSTTDRLIIPPQEAEKLVAQATQVYLRECPCRIDMQVCPREKWEVCLLFEHAPESDRQQA